MARTIYFDGSFSAKTKEMHSALVCDEDSFWGPAGSHGTSSTESEWIAAIHALEYVFESRFRDVVLVGDSKNVIYAMRREIGTGANLMRYRRFAQSLVAEIGPLRWEWIPSPENPAGEVLRHLLRQGKLRPKGILG